MSAAVLTMIPPARARRPASGLWHPAGAVAPSPAASDVPSPGLLEARELNAELWISVLALAGGITIGFLTAGRRR
jgi:hypothetical protein